MKIQDFNRNNHRPPYAFHSAHLIRIKPSQKWLVLHAVIFFCAFLAIVAADFVWVFKLPALIILGSAGVLMYQQHKQQPTFHLRYFQQAWWLIDDQSADERYCLQGWSFSTIFLLILQVEDLQGEKQYFPVMKDSCREEDFRWLTVMAKTNFSQQ